MTGSSSDHEIVCSRTSLPSTPIPGYTVPLASYSFDTNRSSRSTSMSRACENLRQGSTNFLYKIEHALHQDSERSSDGSDSSEESAAGIVIKIPRLPKHHSPASVAKVVYEAFETLESPRREGRLHSLATSDLIGPVVMPDMLDSPSTCPRLSNIQPAALCRSSHQSLVSHVKPSPVSMKGTEKVFADFQDPPIATQSTDLLDLEIQSHGSFALHNSQQHSTSRKSADPTLGRRVHPDLQNLVSFFEQKNTKSPHRQDVNAQRSSSKDEESTVRKSDGVARKHVRGKQHADTSLPGNSQLPQRQNESTTSRSQTVPTSTDFPPTYLGTGLRPVPIIPARPLKLLIPPAQPTVVVSVTPVRHSKDVTTPDQASPASYRTLNRKRNEQDLRKQNQHSPVHTADLQKRRPVDQGRPVSVPKRIAEKIFKFEKALPELPIEASQSTAATKKSRRLGVYGPISSSQNVDIPGTKKAAEEADVKTKERQKAKPFGNFQPYCQTPNSPNQGLDLLNLPKVPHVKKGSILEEIKKELFPDWDINSTVSAPTMNSLTQKRVVENKAKTIPMRNSLPGPSNPTTDSKLPYLPYSRTLVRKGTLQQLGGRVVEIRNQSDTKDETKIMPTSPASKRRDRSIRDSQQSIPRRRGHNQGTTMSPHQPPPSSPFYTHTNSPIETTTTQSRRMNILPSPISHKPTTRTSRTYSPRTTAMTPTNSPTSSSSDLYTLLHPTHLDPTTLRERLSASTRTRLEATADEVDLAASWKRAVETGHTNEVVRKLDYAWEWKRFGDVEWDDRERERLRKEKRRKGGDRN